MDTVRRVISGFVVGWCALYLFVVLLGSTLLNRNTAWWALLQAGLAVVPLYVADDTGSAGSVATAALVFLHEGPAALPPTMRRAMIPSATSLFGSFCGSLLVLLDWGRPWQPWPIPAVRGCLIGAAVGWAWAAQEFAWSGYRQTGHPPVGAGESIKRL